MWRLLQFLQDEKNLLNSRTSRRPTPPSVGPMSKKSNSIDIALQKTCTLCPMGKEKLKRPLWKDPVSGEDLHISELACDESGVTIRGKFEIPRYSKLDAEQERFLETFLRCRGMLNSMERELGISYPTVKARLETLLEALGLTPVKDEAKQAKQAEKKQKVLDMLEKGEITAEEAKAKLRNGSSK